MVNDLWFFKKNSHLVLEVVKIKMTRIIEILEEMLIKENLNLGFVAIVANFEDITGSMIEEQADLE